MNIWRIGSNWDDENLSEIFKKEQIAFAGNDIEDRISSSVKKNDLVCITNGQQIISIGKVKTLLPLNEINTTYVDRFAPVTAIKFSTIIWQEDNKSIPFGIYDGQGKQFHKAGDFYGKMILNTYTKVMDESKTEEIINLLKHKNQIILQGPPGTGKTRLAKEIAETIVTNNEPSIKTGNTTNSSKEIKISKAIIELVLKVGDKILGKSNKEFEITSVNNNTISLKSNTSKHWKPSFNKIIKSYNEELFNISGRTGGLKTYEDAIAKHLKDSITSGKLNATLSLEDNDINTDFVQLVQFHPSYTYEDFVRGIVVKSDDNNNIIYTTEDKTLMNISNDALQNPNNSYVLIIDEINRANLSSVLGELIYALEYRGEDVNSLYEIDGDPRIELPPNLFIIGTMNTADRSVGQIDYAIRRRFAFINVLPKVLENQALNENRKDNKPELKFAKEKFIAVSKFFIKNEVESVNDEAILESSDFLSDEFKPEDVWLGHSYFIYEKGNFNLKLKYEIKPILKEYVTDGILKDSGDKKIIEEINAL